ncbi:MAG: hypothetical protein IKA25_01670 [Alphaproteobacteria bacterium]|nr:hypothetical protein [Alphaproteobacteria bacterium]MBR1953761.1 hypothetical protein [Alphaproteobacteria bacterium]
MTVFKTKIFSNQNRGASITEVLLAMAIIAIATPFVYNQIAKTNHTIHDIAVARRVMSTRDNALNFVRMNQDKWPTPAQIRLDETELAAISPDAAAGLIDKYSVNGAVITDVYLAFELADEQLRTNKIARHIGGDAAVVGPDNIAYGNTWAVAAPDFMPGDLVYRISRDVAGIDTSRYLHRATSGEDKLNVMERDLDMARHHVYNVATASAKSARIKNGNATFVDTDSATANTIYFSSGANIDGTDVSVGNLRVSGDMSGFRNVYADNINGDKFTTTGRIITDRATILDSVNVSGDFIVKSDSTRTISGFTGISVNSVATPYISTEEMIFYENFGLTVSGELLMSTTPPLKIGNWVFQSTKPPAFSKFELSRGTLPTAPSRNAFSPLIRSGWMGNIQTTISTIN